MANPYSKCGMCWGNMWPPNLIKEHAHLTEEERRSTLKLKYRVRKITRSAPVASRTNSATGKSGRSLAPRRHAYGPF